MRTPEIIWLSPLPPTLPRLEARDKQAGPGPEGIDLTGAAGAMENARLAATARFLPRHNGYVAQPVRAQHS